jgi:hypothetical protein
MGAAAGETLDRLGMMRFRQKAAGWRKRLRAGTAPEQALWEGLLEALGYGGERALLEEVARAVPWNSAAQAAHEGEWLVHRLLLRAEADLRPNLLLRRALRPGNRTARRLQAAAALACRFLNDGGIGAALLGPLDSAAPETVTNLLLETLTVEGTLGKGRALEVIANTVLPVAAALCGGENAADWQGGPAVARFEAAFAALPLPGRYGAVRHLQEAVGGVPVDTRRQQGMLYLLKNYCSQGGCGRCPLS